MSEYMIVKDNRVIGIFCGEKTEDNSVVLPINHEVRVGETLDFYNADYTRKSEVELMKLDLIDIPKGYKIDNDCIMEMTWEEKVIAGVEPLPNIYKIVESKLVEKTEEELFNELSLEDKKVSIRAKRDKLLNEQLWKLERHSQEKELGVKTSLSDEEYKKLLKYIQNLRNIPEQDGFPENVKFPTL